MHDRAEGASVQADTISRREKKTDLFLTGDLAGASEGDAKGWRVDGQARSKGNALMSDGAAILEGNSHQTPLVERAGFLEQKRAAGGRLLLEQGARKTSLPR